MKTSANRHSITDWLQVLFHTMYWMKFLTTHSQWPRKGTWSPSWTTLQTFFKWRSLTCSTPKLYSSCWSCTFPWYPTPICWSSMNFFLCQSTSISRPTSQSHLMSARTTSWLSDTQNLFKLSPALICSHASTSETPSFAREGNWWRQVWKSHA